MWAVDCELHFAILIMLPDVVHVSQMLSQSSTDSEYLRKSQGSVFLHNILTKNSTEFLSKDKFVSFQSVIWSTSSSWKWHNLPNRCGCGCTCATDFYFSPSQGEKEAHDYKLSADHRYVAFISNYSKVDSFHFNAKTSMTVSYKVFIFVSLAVEAFFHSHILTLRQNIWVSATAFLISVPICFFQWPTTCVGTKVCENTFNRNSWVLVMQI